MSFYTATSNANWLQVQSECILRVKEAFDRAAIEVPFSTHTVDVRHIGEPGEAFAPVFEQAARGSAANGSHFLNEPQTADRHRTSLFLSNPSKPKQFFLVSRFLEALKTNSQP